MQLLFFAPHGPDQPQQVPIRHRLPVQDPLDGAAANSAESAARDRGGGEGFVPEHQLVERELQFILTPTGNTPNLGGPSKSGTVHLHAR